MSCACGNKSTVRKYGREWCKECLEAAEYVARKSAERFAKPHYNKEKRK